MHAIPQISASVFQAAWPEGHKPLLSPLAKKVAAIAALSFCLYISPLLGVTMALVNVAIRKVAAWSVHPASAPIFFKQAQLKILDEERMFLKAIHQSVSIKTPDGFLLDGIMTRGKSCSEAVIYVGGNAMTYETDSGTFSNLNDALGDVTCLCVNPRGVLKSEGTSSPDMLPYDVYTAFEYLVFKGYAPDKIVIVGRSLGGSTGTEAAALVQQKYPRYKIGAVSVNSFASLPEEVRGLLTQKNWPTAGKIGSVLFRIWGWHLDAKKAWETLKNPHKTAISHAQDHLIPLPLSMHQTVYSGQKILLGEEGAPLYKQAHNEFPKTLVVAAVKAIFRNG